MKIVTGGICMPPKVPTLFARRLRPRRGGVAAEVRGLRRVEEEGLMFGSSVLPSWLPSASRR
jgi:hypothetical protein